MGKINLLTVFILGVFFVSFSQPGQIFATSGCCSSHGGVSCSAGPQANGKVICNDGWGGSSCYYSEMVMCGGSTTSSSNDNLENLNSKIDQYQTEVNSLQTSSPTPTPVPTLKPTPSLTPFPTKTPSPTPEVKGDSVDETPEPTEEAMVSSASENHGGGTQILGWLVLTVIGGGAYLLFRKIRNNEKV